jgi:PilZ domain
MDAEQRRRSPRHTVEWPAHYRGGRVEGWRQCRLIDISQTGAAIEAFGVGDDETLSGAIELELRAPAQVAELIRLQGTARYSSRTSEGRVRVGIELEPASTFDEELLAALVRLNSFN